MNEKGGKWQKYANAMYINYISNKVKLIVADL